MDLRQGKQAVLAIVLAISSCGVQQATIQPKVITEIRERTEFVHDTAYIEVPQIVERVTTRDTVSYLENEWAKTSANVSNGELHHSLETKPQKRPVEVKTEIVYRDSVVIEERVVEKAVEKELTWWEQTKIKFGGWAILAMALGIALAFVIKKLNAS